jgi:general secretion pathway protein D
MAVLLACFIPASGAWAQAPTAPKAAPARLYSFSFADADVASVANEILGETLRIPFTIDPAVTGKITLRIERRLTADQLLTAFEAVLASNGIVMVRTDGQIGLVPKTKARGVGGVQASATTPRGRAGYQTVAEPLRYATPSEVAKALAAAGSPEVVVYADDKLGLLVLGGTSAEIAAARETIAVFDRSGLADARLRFVTLRTAPAAGVATDLDQLIKAANLAGVAVVPIRQLNAVVILARSSALLDQVESWALRFDKPSLEEASTLWIYKARNVPADAMAEALRSLSQSSSTQSIDTSASGPTVDRPESAQVISAQTRELGAPGGASGFGAEALRVSVEKTTNSVLVMAPASRWRILKSALEQLDRPADQVLIEATVLEVTLNRDFQFGVDWSFVSKNGKISATQSRFESGAVTPVFPGLSVSYLDSSVHAIVDTLAAKTNVEVMSAPKLLALDNQSASLQIGDQVPVVVQRAQGTVAPGAPLVSTTEYRDTGVILKIKPRINGEHTVLIELSQEVSGVSRTTTSGIDSPTIQQRKFQSLLEVREGQTVALGGLISTNRSTDDVGVPLLKDIPVAGGLFKTATKTKRRTELIVLLNAKILRSAEVGDNGLTDLKASMGEIERRGLFEHQ